MLWPWHEQMPNYASYLHRFYDYNYTPAEPRTIPEPERDFRWEDGWELLWMNLGYLPNGDKISANKKTNELSV
jgi:hypothetical protein